MVSLDSEEKNAEFAKTLGANFALLSDPTKETADKGERLALFADISFGLTVLSAVTSFTLFMTHKNKRRRERETARLRIETRGAGASATLKF